MSSKEKKGKSTLDKKKKEPQTFFEKFINARKNDKSWKQFGGCYVWYPDPEKGCVVAEILDRRDATIKGQKFLAVLENGEVW